MLEAHNPKSAGVYRHTPAASTDIERLIYLAIRLVDIIHSTLLSVNGNKNGVLKMYYHFFAFV